MRSGSCAAEASAHKSSVSTKRNRGRWRIKGGSGTGSGVSTFYRQPRRVVNWHTKRRITGFVRVIGGGDSADNGWNRRSAARRGGTGHAAPQPFRKSWGRGRPFVRISL